MKPLLHLDQTTLANMTAALEYTCRKLPPDRDNATIRKAVADDIIAAAESGCSALADLTGAGLRVVNEQLFPPKRQWLRFLRG